MIKRVGLYARVSTADKGQDPENQMRLLRQYCESRKFKIYKEYVDHGSGRKGDRTEYIELMDAVRKRKVDVVMVWKFDRFARSTKMMVNALDEFRSMGVDFISYQENIDTTTALGEFFFNVISAFGQLESSLISERVKIGMSRAKSEGKLISRPRLSEDIQDKIKSLYGQGLSKNKIAKQLSVSYGSVWNYLKIE